jgi:ketosteroid isomerase-like protein
LAEDVEWEAWESNSAQAAGVPWMQAHKGRAAVQEFFAVIGTFQFRKFDVIAVAGSGNLVVSEVEVEAELPNGGAFREQEVHLWSFNSGGKVIRFRHYLDTAKHIAAARGTDTRAAAVVA